MTISPFHFVSMYIWLSAIFPGILKRWKKHRKSGITHKACFYRDTLLKIKALSICWKQYFQQWVSIVLSDKQNAQKYFDKIRREINYGVKFQKFLEKQIQWTCVFNNNNSFIEKLCSVISRIWNLYISTTVNVINT